jgi:Transposase
MAEDLEWFVGIDWASQSHQVCLVDARGECLGERAVAHGGLGIEELYDWLIARNRRHTRGHWGGDRNGARSGRRSLVGTRFLRLWDQSQAAPPAAPQGLEQCRGIGVAGGLRLAVEIGLVGPERRHGRGDYVQPRPVRVSRRTAPRSRRACMR